MRRTIRHRICIPALRVPRVPRVSRCRRARLPRQTARSTACVRRSFKRVRSGQAPPCGPMQVLVPAAPNHEPLVLLAGGWPTELPTATPGYGCAGRHGPHLKACFDLQNELLRSHACRQAAMKRAPVQYRARACSCSVRGAAWNRPHGRFLRAVPDRCWSLSIAERGNGASVDWTARRVP